METDGGNTDFSKQQYLEGTARIIFLDVLRTEMIAVLKPGQANNIPKNYRPIALLNMIYKLLERLLYNRISQNIVQTHNY